MKIHSVLLIVSVLVLPNHIRAQTAVPKKNEGPEAERWQNSWDTFAEKLRSITGVSGLDTLAARDFADIEVTWSGKIEKVEPPKQGSEGSLTIAMKSISLTTPNPGGAGAPAELKHLYLEPGTEEWQAWKACKAGDAVSFQTKIIGTGTAGVFSFFSYQTPEGRPGIITFLHTKGARLIPSSSASRTRNQ